MPRPVADCQGRRHGFEGGDNFASEESEKNWPDLLHTGGGEAWNRKLHSF